MELPAFLKDFLVSNSNDFRLPEITDLLINLVITAVLAYILHLVYIRFGSSVSNKRNFGKNFILLSVTIMFIITFVQNSLALSLGLVGALSIVRFRAAIKEPEELSYLFFAIGIGLGCGSGFSVVTIIAFFLIIGIIIVTQQFVKNEDNQNLLLSITAAKSDKVNLEDLVSSLRSHTHSIDLKRIDENDEYVEVSFFADFKDIASLEKAKQVIQGTYPTANFSFFNTAREY